MLYPLLVGYFTIPNDEPLSSRRTFDWIGALLVTAAQLVLLLSLSLSVALGWKTPGELAMTKLIVVPTLLGVSIFLFLGGGFHGRTGELVWSVRIH
jgi:hypothetical protein